MRGYNRKRDVMEKRRHTKTSTLKVAVLHQVLSEDTFSHTRRNLEKHYNGKRRMYALKRSKTQIYSTFSLIAIFHELNWKYINLQTSHKIISVGSAAFKAIYRQSPNDNKGLDCGDVNLSLVLSSP